MKKTILFLLIFCCGTNIFAQQKSAAATFLTPSNTFNEKRFWTANAACAATFGVAMIGLNYAWYAKYPHVRFHFFNDNREWLQVDKLGHAWTAYSEAYLISNLYQWAGVSQQNAAYYGAAWGFMLQLTIEILDGFSKGWGFSPGDCAANTFGSGLFLGNQLLWKEQRIQLKFSTNYNNYNFDYQLQQRANDLYGTSLPQRALKDYNAQSYWLSFNAASFLKQGNNFPKWLNFAVGYGAENLFGAQKESWHYDVKKAMADTFHFHHSLATFQNGDLPRIRQFFISPDINLSQISTHSILLKNAFLVLNIFKTPAPALELNSKRKIKFHFLYF